MFSLGGGFSRVVDLEPHPVPANCHILGIANTERTIHGAHDYALVDHQNDQALCYPDQEHPPRGAPVEGAVRGTQWAFILVIAWQECWLTCLRTCAERAAV